MFRNKKKSHIVPGVMMDGVDPNSLKDLDPWFFVKIHPVMKVFVFLCLIGGAGGILVSLVISIRAAMTG